MQAISIGFHNVAEDGVASRPIAPGHTTLYTVDRRQLRVCLEAIRLRAGAQAVHRLDLVELADGAVPVLLTVDDGALSTYTCLASELEKFGWCGHFFVTTDWIGKPGFVNALQIRELHERGHVIGSHSCSHPDAMSSLDWDELVREWSNSCTVLSDIIGQRVTVASVPGGYYSQQVARAAAASGITTLFTSEPTATASLVDRCLVLGRYSVRRSTHASVVGAIAAGSQWARSQQAMIWFAKKAAKRVMGQAYLALRERLVNRGSPVCNPD